MCPFREIDVIRDALDVKATLAATPHSPYVLFRDRGESLNPPMEVDASGAEVPDFGGAVELEEEEHIQALLHPSVAGIWTGSTVAVNPKFCPKRNRQWIDLLALEFVRTHERQPDDPNLIYRIDEAESSRDGRLISEPGDAVMNDTDEVVEDDNVIIDNRYDSSVAVDAMLSNFEPGITPLMQGEEGKGFSRLNDLAGIDHVIVVGPFCSGTNAMCEYLEVF